MKAPLALIVLAFVSTTALGQLAFQSETLEFTERAETESIRAVFPFRNDGDSPVTIAQVRTSCGCTTAKLSKMTYEPGETGEIEVMFKFGIRTGQQRKQILVQYADAKFPDQKLTLKVYIKETVEIEPKLVYWRLGSEPVTRTMRVKIEPESGVRIAEIKSTSPAFAVSSKPEGDNRYVISVTPRSTEKPQYSLITVEARSESGGEPRKYLAYARVQ